MPAKKAGKKSKKKSPKKEIRQMPSLVYNNVRMTKGLDEEKNDAPEEIVKEIPETPAVEQPVTAPVNIREKFIEEQLAHHNSTTLWLYIGMGILLGAIVFFWGYSIWSNISTFKWEKTPESKMINTGKTDLNQIFQTTKQNELQNQLTKLQIQESLRKALQNIPVTTTITVNTATPTSTTSTLITTSTIVTTTKN